MPLPSPFGARPARAETPRPFGAAPPHSAAAAALFQAGAPPPKGRGAGAESRLRVAVPDQEGVAMGRQSGRGRAAQAFLYARPAAERVDELIVLAVFLSALISLVSFAVVWRHGHAVARDRPASGALSDPVPRPHGS